MEDNKLDKSEESVKVNGRVFDGRAGFTWEAVGGEKDGSQLLELMGLEKEAKSSSPTASEKEAKPESKKEAKPESAPKQEPKPAPQPISAPRPEPKPVISPSPEPVKAPKPEIEKETKAEITPKPEKEHRLWGAKKAKPEKAPKPKREKKPKPEKAPKPKREKKPKPPKPPKAPKPKAEGENKSRLKIIRTVVAALVLIVIACAVYEFVAGTKVTVSYATFDGTTEIGYRTKAENAGALFKELSKAENLKGKDIKVSSEDILMQDTGTKVKRGMVIDIRHPEDGPAYIKGEKKTIHMFPGDVKEILDHNGIKYDDDDEITPSLSRAVKGDTRIKVDEVHYKEEEKTEEVEAEDTLVLDPTLASGDTDYIEGNDGEGVFIYKTKYINGEKDSVERTMKEWVEKSQNNVLRLGTSATGNKGEYSSDESLDTDVSAYTAEAGTRGSTGKLLHIGSCAVDPEEIPLGSELWIEGYGYAYANDTVDETDKTDIKVFVGSKKQLDAWENTECKVYILKSAEV